MNGQGQLYPVGSIGDISIYIDPYMKYNDNRVVLGRKNNPTNQVSSSYLT
jgi:hypothetical protein